MHVALLAEPLTLKNDCVAASTEQGGDDVRRCFA
jgi:hypothetical protein